MAEANDPLKRKIGQPLWDDDYGYGDQLRELQKNTPARTWSALYQQRPAPEEGDFFKVEWLRPYTHTPDLKTLRVYGGSDYAVTEDGGDYTVHAVVGIDPEDRMYLLDLWRKQAASDEWVEAFCDLVKEWKPVGWAEEQGQIKSGLYVPVNAPWYPAFRSELLSFPAGKHDDCVDAIGLVGQLLDKMTAGLKQKPAEETVPVFKGYKPAKQSNGESFKTG
jgi:phage terminase large subunit-like protein